MTRRPPVAEESQPVPDPRLYVNSIENGMTILELFETEQQELSLTDIVARSGFGRSAVQRYVYSLHHLDYLGRDPATKRYSLGPKVLRLYRGYLGGRSALQRARRFLVELNQTTKEAVAWAELLGNEIIIVESLASAHLTSVTLAPGMRFEALSASSGQVLLAYAKTEIVQQVFQASSAVARQRAGTPDLAAVSKLLERVRSQGYSLTKKAFDQESVSISVPVFALQGRVVGAINLSTLRVRFDRKDALADLVAAVQAAARSSSQ